jgi:hypothetical protein
LKRFDFSDFIKEGKEDQQYLRVLDVSMNDKRDYKMGDWRDWAVLTN